MNQLDNIGPKSVSVINDPFVKGKIRGVSVSSWESELTPNKFYHQGKVTFKNGNTTGEQEFNGNSFDDVVLQIKACLDAL